MVGKDGETPDLPKFDPPQDGKPGVGIADALIDNGGALVLTLTDGRALNLGRVVGKDGETPDLPKFDPPQDGKPGVGIEGAEIRDDDHLHLRLTDGREIDAGLARKPAETVKGDPGVGIASAEISNGVLVFQFTDGRKQSLGRVVGRDARPQPASSAASIEIGDPYRAEIDARDLKGLLCRDLTVNGVTYQILCRS